MKNRDILTLAELTPDEVLSVLDAGARLHAQHAAGGCPRLLAGKTLAMIFQKPSTRTRVSFDMAMRRLGGDAIYLSSSDLQLGRGETVSDTGKVLAGYVDAIMARVFKHRDLEELAAAAGVPVVNGLSDDHHPCQILADLLTLQQEVAQPRGVPLSGLKLTYLGDGNNVCHSLLLGCALVGMRVAVGSPDGYMPDEGVVRQARDIAARTGGGVLVTHDPREAVSGADAVYTDVWTSMGQEGQESARRAKLEPYRVTAAIMGAAAPDAIFLHCLPAHRGEEVTAEVIDGPASRVFVEAHNRLWAQAGLLSLIL